MLNVDASGNPVTQSVVGVTDANGNSVTGNRILYLIWNYIHGYIFHFPITDITHLSIKFRIPTNFKSKLSNIKNIIIFKMQVEIQ